MPLTLVDAYVLAATQAGDQVRRILIPGAGHFEIASPLSFTWPQIRSGHPVAPRREAAVLTKHN